MSPLIRDDEEDFEPILNLPWPTGSGITEADATTKCQEGLLSSPVYTQCQNVLGTNVMDTLTSSCIDDIQVSQSYFIVNAIRSQYIHSRKFIPIGIGIPSGIPNLGWNSKLNTDSNWNSKLNS